jgi:hypothetical protein
MKMLYVLCVKEGALEEICGVTEDMDVARVWLEGEIGGIAPKRVVRDFELGKIDPSNKEARWEGPYKHVNKVG